MKRVLFATILLGSLFLSSCTSEDDMVYPDTPEIATTDDDDNDENGTKASGS